MCHRSAKRRSVFLADRTLHPQTLAVMETRARAAGIRLEVRDLSDPREQISKDVSGVIVQYPDTRGRIREWRPLVEKAQQAGARTVVATDLLALTLLDPPGAFGADVAVGSTQRFGMPMGGGGPARRVPRHHLRARPPDARTGGGRLPGLLRARRLPPRPPDPRAAHPAGPRHQQHLHGAGAARAGRVRLRRLARTRGTPADRPPGAFAHPRAPRGARATRLLHGFRAGLRHPHGGDRRRRDVADPGRRRSAGHQPGPAGGRGRRHLPRRDRELR